jgi:hypothetical protein
MAFTGSESYQTDRLLAFLRCSALSAPFCENFNVLHKKGAFCASFFTISF